MSCFCSPSPTVVTGTSYPQFLANVAALSLTQGGNWTAFGFLTSQNGVYHQIFQQQFAIPRTQRLAFETKRSYLCGSLAFNRRIRC